MKGRNGYFQFYTKGNDTFIKLIPPVGEGRPPKIEEIVAFCVRHQIKSIKMVAVNEALKNLKDAPVDVHILDEAILPISESVDVKISSDRMSAICVFYPPSNEGRHTDKANVLDDIRRFGVKFGINEKVIDAFLADRHYCQECLIARGKPVVEGRDAVITYNFNTKPSYKPTENEDGSVDFHNLNIVSSVKKGDVLATLVPADFGENGSTVTGEKLLPRKVRNLHLLPGKNTKLSEDGLTLYADVNGHAILDLDGKVVVSDVLEIKGDIDTSTGDIKYEGSVVIAGNVKTGYRVEATGNIDIGGVVEGATVIAGGDVVLRRGIQGMNRANLRAGGNLMAKFIENARVVVEGNVESGSILNSEVIAKKEVCVRGRKGVLVGGSVRAGVIVEAQNVGSTMGSTTKISVGVDAETQDRIKNLRAEYKELQADEYRTKQLLDVMRAKLAQGNLPKEHILTLQKTTEHYEELTAKMDALDDEIYKLSEENKMDVINTRIRIRDRINPGVTIEIAGEYLNINDEYRYCQFVKKDGEIKRIPL